LKLGTIVGRFASSLTIIQRSPKAIAPLTAPGRSVSTACARTNGRSPVAPSAAGDLNDTQSSSPPCGAEGATEWRCASAAKRSPRFTAARTSSARAASPTSIRRSWYSSGPSVAQIRSYCARASSSVIGRGRIASAR
jgi:hypothetical protein